MHTPLYDRIGAGYGALRVPDPRIAAAITGALGDATSVANVGAGARGSYERATRSPHGRIPALPRAEVSHGRPRGTHRRELRRLEAVAQIGEGIGRVHDFAVDDRQQ
jgi:hypothetical protein